MECVRFSAALRYATHREGLSRLQGPIQSARAAALQDLAEPPGLLTLLPRCARDGRSRPEFADVLHGMFVQ